MLYDLFICHASEDKAGFVRPLADALRGQHVEVWYDEFSLKLGDSIRQSLDRGLKQSRFGIVVLSKAFFDKQWPQYELDGLAEREMKGRDTVILPIWHGVSHDDVMNYSPSLAGRRAVSSAQGIEKVASEILAVIHPQGSPLIIARDMLIEWGLTPPVITDTYWLDIVEASNRVPGFGAVIPEESGWSRWSFPLPLKEGGAMRWGERLAWTAMQMNWVKTAEEVPITVLSPPRQVLNFIHAHPGLFETCLDCPDLLVEYAPQLSIPGFGGDLEQSLEEEYKKSCAKRTDSGSALTTTGRPPLCDEEWALRHLSFGDYEPGMVANAYFAGGIFGPTVSPYEHADHTFWLLSSSSSWLPSKIREYLLEGMLKWAVWSWGYGATDKAGDWKSNGALTKALYELQQGKPFGWTKIVMDDFLQRAGMSIKILKLPESPEQIFASFVEHDFVGMWFKAQKKRRMTRKKLKRRSSSD